MSSNDYSLNSIIIIIISISIIIIDRLIGLVVSMSDYWSYGRGFNPGTSTNFKCGLGMERGPPSLVRTIGELPDWEVAALIKKVDINRLDGA